MLPKYQRLGQALPTLDEHAARLQLLELAHVGTKRRQWHHLRHVPLLLSMCGELLELVVLRSAAVVHGTEVARIASADGVDSRRCTR